MSESWKNRLWSLLLVCTFAVVLSVCNKALDSSSDGSSNSGTAFADGSTVTISSLPSVTVSSAPMPTISGVMICMNAHFDSSTYIYSSCDASDDTELTTIDSKSLAIKHDDAFTSGWKLVGPGCSFSTGATTSSDTCYLFHK